MISFGFSAFLKMVCLNDRPQRTLMRERLLPSSGGYDFHRSLKLGAKRYMIDGEQIEEILASLDNIAREPERKSARAGLLALQEWRKTHPGELLNYPPANFISADERYQVLYSPDFAVRLGRKATAIHIWNTKSPNLQVPFVYGCLSLFKSIYNEQDNPPDDIAVLSLRNGKLYQLSTVGDHSGVGKKLAGGIDILARSVSAELGLPAKYPKDPPPAAPPPA